MKSRSLKASQPKAPKQRSVLSRMKEAEADREMNVARGQADASRTKTGEGSLGLTRKDKLNLGRAAAKNMIAATRKKNKARQGK